MPLLLLLVGGAAAPASAHASLVSTDPADGEVLAEGPGAVTFTFNEPVSLAPNGLQAYDAAGQPVETEGAARDAEVTGTLPDGLEDGTYVVTYRVISADGHPIAGSLTFHVGAPSETVVPPDVSTAGEGVLRPWIAVAQGIGYAALLLAGGLVVFLGWVARGVPLAEAVRRRLIRLLYAAAGVAVLVSLLLVPLSGAYQQGLGPGGLLESASWSTALVGDAWTVFALQAAGLGVACARGFGGSGGSRTTPSLAADLGAAVAVWSPAVSGHTRAYEPTSLLVVTDAVHLSAGAVWLGGLVGLVLALRALAGRPREAAMLLSRFSTIGAALLALLVATGVLLGWRIAGAWAPLWEETWGRLLLAKVAVVAVVALVAGLNRYRLVPRVAAVDAGHESRQRAARLVRRAVTVEAVLLVAVLGLTGFLSGKPPAGEGGAGPASAGTGAQTALVDDHRVVALVSAGTGRQRQVSLQVQDETGEPIDLVDAPTVSLSSDSVDLGELPVRPSAAGTYVADVTFPTLGTWELQVSLPVDRFETPVTTVELTVE